MASREENEQAWELRLLWRRRIMYVVLLVAAIALSIWFVQWVSQGLGMNKIGEHYKQADEF